MDEPHHIRAWLQDHFPCQPHIYFGLSGATLLGELLRVEPRSTVVLPAFICPSISIMAARAGKRVIHIDANPATMHPEVSQLEKCLERQDASDTVVLIDHSFGYPFPGLDGLKRRFPSVLLIEDCARAFGIRIHGQFPGQHADWVLLSMYKTIPGSLNGAILLTRAPAPLKDATRVAATVRERASTIAPLRFVYDFLKRGRPDFSPRRTDQAAPAWCPAYGLPSRLCMERFSAELENFDSRAATRRLIAQELMGALSQIAGVSCIRVAADCDYAGHFVSFRFEGGHRNAVLTRLHRKGLFLSRTWDLLPAHYPDFFATFPNGHSGSDHLAAQIAHIPVNLFLRSIRRNALISAIGTLSHQFTSAMAA